MHRRFSRWPQRVTINCNLLVVTIVTMLLWYSAPVSAAPEDRSGMFCVDLSEVVSKILIKEGAFDDAKGGVVIRSAAFKNLDRSFGFLAPVMYDLNGQYGPEELFAPMHELAECNDDVQWNTARAMARYNVAALDYERPTAFLMDKGGYRYTSALSAVCDFRRIGVKLNRKDPFYQNYENQIREYYAKYRLRLPSDICEAY